MASRFLHTAAAAIGIAALAVGAWYWQSRVGAKGGPGPAPAAASAPVRAGAGGAGGAGGPPPVEVGRVEALTLTDDAQAVGSLRSHQGVVLRPEVSGRVAQIGFADGQRVRRGQLLLQLDDNLQQAQLQQAEAQASIARTNLQRSRELLTQGFISQSAVDQNEAALQVAEAQVALARAQLARMKLHAPFDAVAGIRLVHVGDYLKDGADIVNLEDTSSMAVDFRLPERYLARVRPGLPVEVAVDALPGQSFRGQVEAVDSQVDANGRALLVRARVANATAVLRPGMFARPRIVFAVRPNATVVPEEALVPLGAQQYVYKVVDDGKGGRIARRVEARLGLRLPGKAEVLDGLAAGDQVVTAGQARLGKGEQVAVRVIDLNNPGGTRGGGGKGTTTGNAATDASPAASAAARAAPA